VPRWDSNPHAPLGAADSPKDVAQLVGQFLRAAGDEPIVRQHASHVAPGHVIGVQEDPDDTHLAVNILEVVQDRPECSALHISLFC
jgi:hypothetical protein